MIITNEIEQQTKKKKDHSGLYSAITIRPEDTFTYTIATLARLRKKHPELDYADELLEMVKALHNHVGCAVVDLMGKSTGKCKHTKPCEQAQALIEKIENKNGEQIKEFPK